MAALPFASGAPASAESSTWMPPASSPGSAAWVAMANRAPRTAATTTRASATQMLRFQASLTLLMTSSVPRCGGAVLSSPPFSRSMTRVRDSTVTLAVGPHEPPELAHEGDAKAGARRALAYGRGLVGLVDRPLDVDRGHSPGDRTYWRQFKC